MKKQISLLIVAIILTGIQSLHAQEYSSKVTFAQPELSIREVRKNAITGNIGWNSLTGIGIIYHNYLNPQMGLEMGVGLATTGVKFGGRLSYLFSKKNFSPFVAGGFMYALGSGDTKIDFENTQTGNKFSYTIDSSPFAQLGGGIEYMSNGGFLVSAILGYAILLSDSNYTITYGSPSSDERIAMDMIIGGGVVLEVTIGFAFGNK